LKIPLIEGRDFDERDRPGSPWVTIINQTLAQRLWADSSPLGRPLVFNNQEYEVVGVFKDSGLHSAIEAPAAFLYISYWQNNLEPQVDSRMVVRVASDPASMLPELRRAIAAVDANVPVAEEMPMSEQVNGKYASVIMSSTILVSSSVLALLFSMVGLYGALAFAVSQRTRELGIRMALGAQAGDLLTMVIKQGMSLVAVGSLVGLAGAYGLARVIASLLFGVTATDPLIYLLTPLGLLLIALLACYIPARRATRVDPLVALRYE
jgi:putative ABC transport system permease protein